jgi:hypothetical protein
MARGVRLARAGALAKSIELFKQKATFFDCPQSIEDAL